MIRCAGHPPARCRPLRTDNVLAATALLGGIARCWRLGGLVHPLLGVTQDLLGRAAGIVALACLLGKRHSAACDMIFGYLGRHTGGYPGRPTGNPVPPDRGNPRVDRRGRPPPGHFAEQMCTSQSPCRLRSGKPICEVEGLGRPAQEATSVAVHRWASQAA